VFRTVGASRFVHAERSRQNAIRPSGRTKGDTANSWAGPRSVTHPVPLGGRLVVAASLWAAKGHFFCQGRIDPIDREFSSAATVQVWYG
jgi:hypothetical protein